MKKYVGFMRTKFIDFVSYYVNVRYGIFQVLRISKNKPENLTIV